MIQQGLYGKTEEELYQIAISKPLSEKISRGITLIQHYEPMALQLSELGYHVGFSGGKDSIVLEKLFRLAGVKFRAQYNNVTIDPPELVRYIKKYYPHIEWANPEKHLCSAIKDRAPGLPTRRGRWCCEIYKEGGGKGKLTAVGVRAEESKRRKGRWSELTNFNGNPVLAPLVYWTDEDVWNFINDFDLPYCELYDQGFTRLGCVGCPLGGNNRYREFERWPKYEQLWKKGALEWWQIWSKKKKSDGTSYYAANFKTFEEYWSWWMEENNVYDSDESDCQRRLAF